MTKLDFTGIITTLTAFIFSILLIVFGLDKILNGNGDGRAYIHVISGIVCFVVDVIILKKYGEKINNKIEELEDRLRRLEKKERNS